MPKDEAREALLALYKDELVSHATILLTLGLLTFTALETWIFLGWSFLFPPIIGIAILLAAWQVFRYLLYGRMAAYLLYAKPKDKRQLAKELGWSKKETLYEVTDIYALSARVDQLCWEVDLPQETPPPERRKTSFFGRWVYRFAHPRIKGTAWQRVAFCVYAGSSLTILSSSLIMELLAFLNLVARAFFALIPLVVLLEVLCFLTKAAMRKKPKTPTNPKENRKKTK